MLARILAICKWQRDITVLPETWCALMMYSFYETFSMNYLDPQHRLTCVLNNIKTISSEQLPNLLLPNFDKNLHKLD